MLYEFIKDKIWKLNLLFDFSDEEDPDGIYDPLYKEKRGGPKFKK